MIEFVLEIIESVHLTGSMFDDVSLLTDTQAFEIVESDADFLVDMACEETSGVHMEPSLVVIPVSLMILFINRQALDLWSCCHLRVPAWLTFMKVSILSIVKSQGLPHVTAVTHLSLEG